jgi:hypothetical protein
MSTIMKVFLLIVSFALFNISLLHAQTMNDICQQYGCPDLATVAIHDVFYENVNGVERIRFTNGIANLGSRAFQIRSQVTSTNTSIAIQEILDDNGNVAWSKEVGVYIYHPGHGHYHINNVATYELRKPCAGDTGTSGNMCDLVSTSNKGLLFVIFLQYFSYTI